MSVKAIVEANHLKDTRRLRVGQELVIPGVDKPGTKQRDRHDKTDKTGNKPAGAHGVSRAPASAVLEEPLEPRGRRREGEIETVRAVRLGEEFNIRVRDGHGHIPGAALHAWRVLPGPDARKAMFTLGFPGLFLGLTLAGFVMIAPARRWVRRYVLMSFKAGFGQTVGSVLWGLGLLLFAAGFIYLQIAGVARGGRYPAGVFSGYAAGIGVILAQALQVRSLERDADVRGEI